MKLFNVGNETADSVELKCLLVSKGVKVDNSVYKLFDKDYRLSSDPLMCNSMKLSDDTIVQLTDISFHLKLLLRMLSWNNLKLIKYESDLRTPFSISLLDNKAALFHEKDFVDFVSFQKKTDFYTQKTASGLPFLGNAVLQGCDFVSFQCLWPCEYAAKGKPCEYCFSGAEFEMLAKKGKSQPQAVGSSDVVDIVRYAVENKDANSIQITGGSTFSGETEYKHISSYMKALVESNIKLSGETLLYITPPKNNDYIDEYFALGADRIACSIEVWDKDRAKIITPGKIHFTSRERHLKSLEYIAEKYGKGKAFSNFIIGLESFETLKEGATYLAERGIIPSTSVWVPMGKPVMGSMKAPGLDYFRKVKEMLAELYTKYELIPAGGCGLNVCAGRDIYECAVSRLTRITH